MEDIEIGGEKLQKQDKKLIFVLCLKCNKNTKFCIEIIDAGLALCIRGGCNKLEYVARRICEFLNYKFISLEMRSRSFVNFICNNGHEWQLAFALMRTGSKCNKCYHVNNISKIRTGAIPREDCDCIGYKKGVRPRICVHYNHAVCFPNSAQYWSSENKIRVDQIAPGTIFDYKWDCPRCGKVFNASPNDRSHNLTFFCSPVCKIPEGCDLQSMYPNICELMDTNNKIDPSQISCGSHKILNLICSKHDIPHRWSIAVGNMVATFEKYEGIGTPGCEHCNFAGYDQKYGGKDYFVSQSNKKHNFEFDYPGDYKGNTTKTSIFCKKPNHGIFYQTPCDHKRGRGCWRCFVDQIESKPCQKLRAILTKLGINFTWERKFDGMKYINCLRIDFYDEILYIAFEYDGEHHFKVTSWISDEILLEIKTRDVCKDKFCLENKMHMYRFCRIEHITEEKIIEIRNMCQPGMKQVYASYPDYIETMSQLMDMTKFNVITIQPLCK